MEFGGKLATRCELIDCCCMWNMILCQITAVVMMMGLLTICLNKGHNCQVPSLKATKSKFEWRKQTVSDPISFKKPRIKSSCDLHSSSWKVFSTISRNGRRQDKSIDLTVPYLLFGSLILCLLRLKNICKWHHSNLLWYLENSWARHCCQGSQVHHHMPRRQVYKCLRCDTQTVLCCTLRALK